jgi:hypothetical protein
MQKASQGKPSTASKNTRIRIRGRWWTIITGKCEGMGNAEGMCDFDAKTIYLKPGTELPATLIYEVAHATFPDLDEDAICALEEAVMNALSAMKLLVPIL